MQTLSKCPMNDYGLGNNRFVYLRDLIVEEDGLVVDGVWVKYSPADAFSREGISMLKLIGDHDREYICGIKNNELKIRGGYEDRVRGIINNLLGRL